MNTDEKYLEILRENLGNAEDDLHEAVASLCPGPHVTSQHRDRKPPWCNACGRDDTGVMRKKSQ